MKQRLFTPGPTPVPHTVRRAMAEPMMHHRDVRFMELFGRVRRRLAEVLGTQSDVVLLAGTGTLAMEAAVTNFVGPKDTVLYVDSGKFGARWGEILRAYGVHAVSIDVPWGQAVQPAHVARALQQYPHASALFLQACETSTGAAHPVQALAALCQASEQCLCIVDGITQVAIEPLPMDAWGVDVLLGATQKSFMMSAGLSIVGVSAKGWKRCEQATLPRFYTDLLRERRAALAGHTAWTSAVSLVYGLDAALDLMLAEGLPALYRRHKALSQTCQKALLGLGCTLFAEPCARGLTVARPPAGISAGEVIARMQQQHGMRIGGGQDHAAGKIIRIAHMGDIDAYDLAIVLQALKDTFNTLAPR